jgi:hypothetical protein
MAKNLIKSFSYKEDKEPIIDELAVIAARERKDTSKIIVELIEQYVKYHSEGNNQFQLDKWNKDPDFQAIPSLDAPIDTWQSCYKNCNDEERTKLRIQAMNLSKWFRTVDINENRR